MDNNIRTPLYLVFGMVVIVLLIAALLKQNSESMTGMVIGEGKDLLLYQKNELVGSINTISGATTYIISEKELFLTIKSSNTEEVVLTKEKDKLTATFEYFEVPTRVDIYPSQHKMILSEPGKSAYHTTVVLTDTTYLDGEFKIEQKNHNLRYNPSKRILIIDNQEIPLSIEEGLLTCTWNEYRIIIDPIRRFASVKIID